MALFQRVCELNLEGSVAKQKFGPYVTEREQSTGFKILNREYSQKDGREEPFERDLDSEPGPVWRCRVLCSVLLDTRWSVRRSRSISVSFPEHFSHCTGALTTGFMR